MAEKTATTCPRRIEGPFKLPKHDEWINGCCSYCGSLEPSEFMRRAEAGEELTPTDKNYKVYVGGSSKFYFQHLDETQGRRFVELLNAKALKFAFPGHFYVLPFFMRHEPKDG